MSEIEEKNVATQADASPASTEAAPAEAPAGFRRLAARLRLVGEVFKGRLGNRKALIVVGSILLFLGITAFMAFFLRGRLRPTEEPTADEAAAEVVDSPGAAPEEGDSPELATQGLAPSELISLAESAMIDGKPKEAIELLDRARDGVAADDVLGRIRIYDALRRACEASGQESHARIHREFVRRLQLRLGPPMPLLSAADDAFAKGDVQAAIRLYNRFLLRIEEIVLDREALVRHTKDRIAEARVAAVARLSTEEKALSLEPREFFR